MARALAALLALLSAASLCRAVFVIEKGGLKVVLPQEAKEKYPGKLRAAPPPTRRRGARPCAGGETALGPRPPSPAGGFDVALANFGSPRYGGTLRARLIYVDPAYGRTETCGGGSCAFGCSDFSVRLLAIMHGTAVWSAACSG